MTCRCCKRLIYGSMIAAVLASAIGWSAKASAESPVIELQQRQYSAARRLWEAKPKISGFVGSEAGRRAPTLRSSETHAVAMDMRNVDFEYTDGIGFHVDDLTAILEPTTPESPVNFDEVDRYYIRIQKGDVLLRPEALDALFNKYILGSGPKSLSDLTIGTSKNDLAATAKLTLNGAVIGDIEIPTSFHGPVTITRENNIRLDIAEITALGFPTQVVMRAFGIGLPTMASLRSPGVDLTDFAFEMDPRKAFPMPEFRGQVSGVRLDTDGLHVSFGDSPHAKIEDEDGAHGSYIHLASGDPKLFGYVITNADIYVYPHDDNSVLRFCLYDYRNQLSKGTARLLENGTIVVRAP